MSEDNVMEELIQFLDPTTRLDVRRMALEHVVGLSAALDGSAGKLFSNADFALGKALCKLCEGTISDRSPTLAALTNFTSGSAEAADFILTNSKILVLAYDACKLGAPFAGYGARLLANLSRHFPDRVHELLIAHDANCLKIVIDLTAKGGDTLVFLGFVAVNLSIVPKFRRLILDQGCLSTIYSYFTLSERHREIAADILRNMAFEEAIHEKLLNTSDDYLVSILTPLADAKDDLDDEEIQKLPLRLQYYEGERETSPHIRQKLIEALYQLCATRLGREKLRSSGVYALLRELDKATREPEDLNAPPPKMKPLHLLAQEEHTLHALIGVLIRYENEMGISQDLASLKELN